MLLALRLDPIGQLLAVEIQVTLSPCSPTQANSDMFLYWRIRLKTMDPRCTDRQACLFVLCLLYAMYRCKASVPPCVAVPQNVNGCIWYAFSEAHLIICCAETDATHAWSKHLSSSWQHAHDSIGFHPQPTQHWLCADRSRLSLFRMHSKAKTGATALTAWQGS